MRLCSDAWRQWNQKWWDPKFRHAETSLPLFIPLQWKRPRKKENSSSCRFFSNVNSLLNIIDVIVRIMSECCWYESYQRWNSFCLARANIAQWHLIRWCNYKYFPKIRFQWLLPSETRYYFLSADPKWSNAMPDSIQPELNIFRKENKRRRMFRTKSDFFSP